MLRPTSIELEYALAVGADEALNAMVATDLSEYFGRDRVFQLPASDERTADFYTRAQVLFDDSATHDELLSRIKAGDEIAVTEAPAAAKNGKDAGADRGAALPMFVLTPGEDLRVLTAGDEPDLKAGQELISLTKRRRRLLVHTPRTCRLAAEIHHRQGVTYARQAAEHRLLLLGQLRVG